jgi:hypothetical protein
MRVQELLLATADKLLALLGLRFPRSHVRVVPGALGKTVFLGSVNHLQSSFSHRKWRRRGWFPFHKDGRIRGNPSERRPIERDKSPMFYLDNQQLSIDEMVRRIHMNQTKIYSLARRRRSVAACYPVDDRGAHKRWP